MLWGQDIKVYTYHKNLTRDALGLTSDRVYHWRLLLEELGWEFQFSVPISGTPIGSGIPISFLIPGILVGNIFLNSAVEKLTNRNSNSDIWNSEKIYVGTQYFSFPTKKQSQNSCRHLYIYLKRLPPSLHLLKMVAAISTSTQNS
jgi:hypothetical protein